MGRTVVMATVRPAAVAGTFYPSDPKTLGETVDGMLTRSPSTEAARVVVAPHAGYVYSGQIAASAYNALPEDTRTVLLLGPTHRVGIEGMALTGADFQRTPLGDIRTDPQLTEALEKHPDVFTAPVVHAQEHSLEVHLPFLQARLRHPFTVVPVAVGIASPSSVAEVIELALQQPDTAVVISSDLSHFLAAETAEKVDQKTMRDLKEGQFVTPEQACGAYPLNGMVQYAAQNGWVPEVLDTGNSGPASKDLTQVVGYASLAWRPDVGPALTWIAADVLAQKLGVESPSRPDIPSVDLDFLDEDGACFVTLEEAGRLRGCIGSLNPRRPLKEDIAKNAVAAGFEDPRFPPLTAEEYEKVSIEVSVLGDPEPLEFTSERDALARLTPGEDGVILSWGPHRATFLPQVWQQLPEPEEFLAALKQKAGLPADFWSADLQIETYPVTSYVRQSEQ